MMPRPNYLVFQVMELAIWIYAFLWAEGCAGNRMVGILWGNVTISNSILLELVISGVILGMAIFLLIIFSIGIFEICHRPEEGIIRGRDAP